MAEHGSMTMMFHVENGAYVGWAGEISKEGGAWLDLGVWPSTVYLHLDRSAAERMRATVEAILREMDLAEERTKSLAGAAPCGDSD